MPRYQDYNKVEFETIEELAEYRIRVKAPLMGGAMCPAAEYTFAVSHDNGASWQNPTDEDKQALLEAVVKHTDCCRNLGAECPAILEFESIIPEFGTA